MIEVPFPSVDGPFRLHAFRVKLHSSIDPAVWTRERAVLRINGKTFADVVLADALDWIEVFGKAGFAGTGVPKEPWMGTKIYVELPFALEVEWAYAKPVWSVHTTTTGQAPSDPTAFSVAVAS